MLKKTFGKRLAGGIVTAAMLAASSVAMLPSMGFTAAAASGAEMLGQTDFDDGVGLPWHTCVSQPAVLTFDIDGGSYNITIVNPGGEARGGASRWDCQFRHRKLKIRQGDKYHLHAEVTASNDGEIYSKIGDLAGTWDNEVWHNAYMGTSEASYPAVDSWGMGGSTLQVKAGEKFIFDAEFEAKTTLDTAEWAFHFGGAGEHQSSDCFPVDTVLKFDNMSLVNLSGNDGWVKADPPPENSVHVNQVGYYPALNKIATYHTGTAKTQPGTSISSAGKFYVINASTKEKAYTGDYAAATTVDKESGFYATKLDFSELTTPGTYYISMDGSSQDSYTFKIGEDIYDGITADAINYFYQNRAGVPIEEKYITLNGESKSSKSELAHTKYGHNPDKAYIQNAWIKAYKSDGTDVQKSNGTMEATDGWYDAGDHGKYVVNGGISVWTLQNMYEWTLLDTTKSDKDKFGDSSKSMVVPEAGNKIPDILDETKVELEFFREMMVPDDSTKFVYPPEDWTDCPGKDTGKYKNMVYHKLHDSKWTGLAVHAWDYQDSKDWAGIERIVKPPTTAATLNASATFAQAARLFEPYDAAYAKELKQLAIDTYQAAKDNPKLYAPLDQAIGGGAYGDDHCEDDFYWAACELYITTGDEAYKKDLESYSEYAYQIQTTLSGGENHGTFTSFNWGNTASLGSLSMYLNADKIDSSAKEKIIAGITKAADAYIDQMAKEAFSIPYTGSQFTDPINIPKVDGKDVVVEGYEWGSNSMVINNAIVLAYAYNATGDAQYLNGASNALDYLYGRNALDFSFVTGYGTYHCENPHHRLWSHENDEEFPYAPSGVLSGGPNAGMQDPYVAGMGYKRGKVASQLCYVDSIEAWSVNEVTINWNSPLAWMMSFIEDEYEPVDGPTPGPGPGPNPTDTDWGNVDCSAGDTPKERVTVGDAVLLARLAGGDASVTEKVTDVGKANADVKHDGALDQGDLDLLLKFIVGSVAYEELGK